MSRGHGKTQRKRIAKSVSVENIMGSGKGQAKRINNKPATTDKKSAIGVPMDKVINVLSERKEQDPNARISQTEFDNLVNELALTEELEGKLKDENIWKELDEKNNALITRDKENGVNSRHSKEALELLMNRQDLFPEGALEKFLIYTDLRNEARGVIEFHQDFLEGRVASYDTLARELQDPEARRTIAAEINGIYKEVMVDILLDLDKLAGRYSGDAH